MLNATRRRGSERRRWILAVLTISFAPFFSFLESPLNQSLVLQASIAYGGIYAVGALDCWPTNFSILISSMIPNLPFSFHPHQRTTLSASLAGIPSQVPETLPCKVPFLPSWTESSSCEWRFDKDKWQTIAHTHTLSLTLSLCFWNHSMVQLFWLTCLYRLLEPQPKLRWLIIVPIGLISLASFSVSLALVAILTQQATYAVIAIQGELWMKDLDNTFKLYPSESNLSAFSFSLSRSNSHVDQGFLGFSFGLWHSGPSSHRLQPL